MYSPLSIFDSHFSSCALHEISLSPHLDQSVWRSYIVHSAFALIFPLHLLFLVLTMPVSLEALLAGLSLAIKFHYAPSDQNHLATLQSPFPRSRILRLITFLTLGITIPSLLWFVSVSLSP
jgi:hypothetical protein